MSESSFFLPACPTGADLLAHWALIPDTKATETSRRSISRELIASDASTQLSTAAPPDANRDVNVEAIGGHRLM